MQTQELHVRVEQPFDRVARMESRLHRYHDALPA